MRYRFFTDFDTDRAKLHSPRKFIQSNIPLFYFLLQVHDDLLEWVLRKAPPVLRSLSLSRSFSPVDVWCSCSPLQQSQSGRLHVKCGLPIIQLKSENLVLFFFAQIYTSFRPWVSAYLIFSRLIISYVYYFSTPTQLLCMKFCSSSESIEIYYFCLLCVYI